MQIRSAQSYSYLFMQLLKIHVCALLLKKFPLKKSAVHASIRSFIIFILRLPFISPLKYIQTGFHLHTAECIFTFNKNSIMYFLHFPDKLMKLDYAGNKNSSMLGLIMGILTFTKMLN